MKDVVLHCSIFFKWNKLVRVREFEFEFEFPVTINLYWIDCGRPDDVHERDDNAHTCIIKMLNVYLPTDICAPSKFLPLCDFATSPKIPFQFHISFYDSASQTKHFKVPMPFSCFLFLHTSIVMYRLLFYRSIHPPLYLSVRVFQYAYPSICIYIYIYIYITFNPSIQRSRSSDETERNHYAGAP